MLRLILFATIFAVTGFAHAQPPDSTRKTYDQLLDSMRTHNGMSAGETWALTAVPVALVTMLASFEVMEKNDLIDQYDDQPTLNRELIDRQTKYKNRYQVIEIAGVVYCIAAVFMLINEHSQQDAVFDAQPYASLSDHSVGIAARFRL